VVISVVIAILFVSAYIEPRIGTLVTILWVLTVALLIIGLVYFLRETFLAADGPKQDLRP
jgi:cytochrome c-type biogenesis protein CcmH/NrfF